MSGQLTVPHRHLHQHGGNGPQVRAEMFMKPRIYTPAHPRPEQTTRVETHTVRLEEDGVRLALTVVG